MQGIWDEITKGETNYTKETNHLKAPLKGFYSSIIKLTEEKNLPNYYQSPHCKSMKSHKNDYFNDSLLKILFFYFVFSFFFNLLKFLISFIF